MSGGVPQASVPARAGELGTCHVGEDTQAPVCSAVPHCCVATECKDSTTEPANEPVQRPALPMDRCCEDGNCLCSGALLAKSGIELQTLIELDPCPVVLTGQCWHALQRAISPQTHPWRVVFLMAARLSGGALRLRIESLLI